MALTAFTKRLGETQGRIAASDPPDGSFVFVLGSEVERAFEMLEPGDYVEVKQALDLEGLRYVRANMLFRVPESLPAGHKWRADLVVDGVVQASAFGNKGKTRRLTDLVALVPQPVVSVNLNDAASVFASQSLLSLNANNPGAVVTSGSYVSVPNTGSLGGSATALVGPGPEQITDSGQFGMRTTTNGGMTLGTTSSFQALHDPATLAEISFEVRFDNPTPAVDGWIFATRTSAATSRGVVAYQDVLGRLVFVVSDGASNVVAIQTGTGRSGRRLYRITKRLLTYSLYEDGALVQTVTAASLTAGPSGAVLQLGSRTTDSNRFEGAIFSCDVFPYDASIGPPYVSVPNRGSAGGLATSVAGAGPERIVLAGANAGLTNVNGGLQVGDLNTFRALHEPGTKCELSFEVELDPLTGSEPNHSWLFSTRDTVNGRRGLEIIRYSSGSIGHINFRVDNGVTSVLDLTTSAPVASGRRSFRLYKDGLTYSLYVDGVMVRSGSASSLVAGPHYHVGCIGGRLNDSSSTAWRGRILSFKLSPYDTSVPKDVAVRLSLVSA